MAFAAQAIPPSALFIHKMRKLRAASVVACMNALHKYLLHILLCQLSLSSKKLRYKREYYDWTDLRALLRRTIYGDAIIISDALAYLHWLRSRARREMTV